MKPSEKIKITIDLDYINEEKIHRALTKAIIEAEQDYKRKKQSKGEKVDLWKMNKAINQRKKLKILGKLMLAKVFHRSNILNLECIDNTSNKLLREVEDMLK